MDEFSPYLVFKNSLQKWWVIVLLMILGGIGGWSIHFFNHPLYEAKASFSVMVDLKKSGPIDTLTQDKSINVVYDTFFSDQVVEPVLAAAQKEGINIDRQTFISESYAERKSETWELRIRNPDPKVAQTLVNLWADQAYSQLKTYSLHAQQADALTLQLNMISMCIQQAYLPFDTAGMCDTTDQQKLAQEYQTVSTALYNERVARGSLASWVLFSLDQKAALPTRPVSYNINEMTLAGAVIGFLLAIGLIATPLPDKLTKKFKRIPQESASREPSDLPKPPVETA